MKTYKIVVLTAFLTILSCQGQSSKAIANIDAKDFAEKIKTTPNAQLLDVRTPEEFGEKHIDRAENLDFLSSNFVVDASKLDKTKPVFVYCKAGGRSAKAAKKLDEMGFTTIYDLNGGFLKWEAASLSEPSDKIIGMCNQEYGELLNTNKKVLVEFYTDESAPCKEMTSFLMKMETELKDKITLVRLNANENKTMAKDLKIDELPTLLLYEKKEVKWKHTGFISEADLRKQL